MAKVIKAGLKVEIDEVQEIVTITAREGDTVLDRSMYDVTDLPADIRNKILLKGCATILQQRASDIKEDPEAKLMKMDEVFEMWKEGQYEAKREGGARTVAPIIEVLATKKGASTASVQKSWAKLSDEQKKAIEAKFADEVKAVKEAREGTEVDLTDLV